MGLIDINQLINTKKADQAHVYDEKVAGLGGKNHQYDEKVAGEKGELAGSKRPQNGGVAGWFKAFGEQGFTPIFRENSKKRHIGGIKKMASYRYNRTINIEEKAAAKEKNKRLFPDILSLISITAKRVFLPFSC